jgi:hypothetical protein
MTFIPEARLESRAADLWRRYHLEPGFDVEALLDTLGLSLLWDDLPEDVLGALKADEALVILNERRVADFEANPGWERFTACHEVGHWLFHGDRARTGTLPMLEGGRTWCRDGSRDPEEIQADRFASYVLIPTDRLHPFLPAAPWSGWAPVYRLAERFRVTATAMIVRLERGNWAHRDVTGTPRSGRRPEPDTGQGSLPLA